MNRGTGVTFDVRIWTIHRYKGARGTTYTVKWGVAGRRHQRTFATHKLAEAFRADLLVASRQGVPFFLKGGLPATLQTPEPAPTWLEHAMQYVSVKWPAASPRHRRGIAESLTDVTLAVVAVGNGAPKGAELRRVLYSWAFNATARERPLPDGLSAAFTWLQRHSPLLSELEGAALLRTALDRLAIRQDGSPAAPSTVARKRATLHNVLEYAVELELYTSNPLKRVRWKAPKRTDVVDRRAVVNRLRRGRCWKRFGGGTRRLRPSSRVCTTPGSGRARLAAFALRTAPFQIPAGEASCSRVAIRRPEARGRTRPPAVRSEASNTAAARRPGSSPPIQNSLRRFAGTSRTFS